MSFINKELQINGYKPLDNLTIDILKLSRFFLNLQRYSLENVAKNLNIQIPPGMKIHSAIGDAMLAAKVFFIFIDKLRDAGSKYLTDILEITANIKSKPKNVLVNLS
jgi:DNA polymerase III alpha subunit (gram-positive type)